MILVAVLLCTLLRGVRMQESKIAAITLLTQAAMHCDDDTRLQRIVPYLLVCHADIQIGLPLTQLSSKQASHCHCNCCGYCHCCCCCLCYCYAALPLLPLLFALADQHVLVSLLASALAHFDH